MMFSERFANSNPFIRVNIYFFADLVFFLPRDVTLVGPTLKVLYTVQRFWQTVFFSGVILKRFRHKMICVMSACRLKHPRMCKGTACEKNTPYSGDIAMKFTLKLLPDPIFPQNLQVELTYGRN